MDRMEMDWNLKTLANVFKLFPRTLKKNDIYTAEVCFYPQIKVISSVECSKTMFFMSKVAYHSFQNSSDKKKNCEIPVT